MAAAETTATRTVDRLLGFVVLLGLAALAALALMTMTDAIPLGRLAGRIEQLAAAMGKMGNEARMVVAVVAGMVGVISLGLLLQRLRPGGRRPGRHLLHADEVGIVSVRSESVQTVAEAALRRLGGVISAEVRILSITTGAVAVRATVVVGSGVVLPALGAKGKEAVASAIQDLVGLMVQSVQIELVVASPRHLERLL